MTTKEFIQYVSERPELCNKMSACTAPEEAYVVAKEIGLTDDMDIFVQVMTETKSGMEKLSDDDLDTVNAAGSSTVVCSVVYSTLSSACISAAASMF